MNELHLHSAAQSVIMTRDPRPHPDDVSRDCLCRDCMPLPSCPLPYVSRLTEGRVSDGDDDEPLIVSLSVRTGSHEPEDCAGERVSRTGESGIQISIYVPLDGHVRATRPLSGPRTRDDRDP